MKPLFGSLIFLSLSVAAGAQCTILANAVAGITLVHQNTNCFNNSGVAYNPNLNLYYACRAGNSGFPYETWSSAGAPLFNTTTGNDFRGLWWNPTLSQLEGNSYNSAGIWRSNLNASGYALNTGAMVLASGQPNAQSCGDLDWQAYEILYYSAGFIYRYSRTTGAALGNYAITGTPVALANLNSTTLMYTGCAGQEIALLDYVNKRVYFYNKATGAYVATSQLPAGAITTASFRVSWANNLIWLFNLANYTWYSYQVFSVPLPIVLTSFTAACNNGLVTFDWTTASETDNDYFTIERTIDGNNFEAVAVVDGAGTSSQANVYQHELTEPVDVACYYRLKQTDFNGDYSYSDNLFIDCSDETDLLVLYPNPGGDVAYVEGCQVQDIIIVFDASGRKVYEISIAKEGRAEIDLSQFAPGMYHVQINSGTKVIHKELLVE